MTDNLETKTDSDFVKIKANLNKGNIEKIEEFYHFLKSKGIKDTNMTKAMTTLMNMGYVVYTANKEGYEIFLEKEEESKILEIDYKNLL